MAQIPDLKQIETASRSLANDVNNLRRAVSRVEVVPEEESKVWAFQGSSGRRVLVDRRAPDPPPANNPRYTSSAWKIGARATEIHPISGQHTYDTGNLYRTVHWKDDSFGLNGYFTNDLARCGVWRNDGLNVSLTRSKAVEDPAQWGTPKHALNYGS